MTTGKSPEAARIERLFLVATVPVLALMIASLYVRVTSDSRPFWTELSTPLFFALIGARAIAMPWSPETRKVSRIVGALLIAFAAFFFFLAIRDFQGAN